MEEKQGGHRKGNRLGCLGCNDARGMCSLLIQSRESWQLEPRQTPLAASAARRADKVTDTDGIKVTSHLHDTS